MFCRGQLGMSTTQAVQAHTVSSKSHPIHPVTAPKVSIQFTDTALVEGMLCACIMIAKLVAESMELGWALDTTTSDDNQEFFTVEYFGCKCSGEQWCKLLKGHKAKIQGEHIQNLHNDLMLWQSKLNLEPTQLYQVCNISFDNTGSNTGWCGGLKTELDKLPEVLWKTHNVPKSHFIT
jgi:hypothetical protein